MADSAVTDMFGGTARRLKPGQMVLRTKIADLGYNHDKNNKSLEKPVFLHKGQTSVKAKHTKHNPLNGAKLGNVAKKAKMDKKSIKKRLDKLKAGERLKKLKACITINTNKSNNIYFNSNICQERP